MTDEKPAIQRVCGPARGAKIILAVCVAWFLCQVAFIVQPTNIGGLALLPFSISFLVVLIISFVSIFRQWKAHGLFAIVPFLICVFVLLVSKPVGVAVGDTLFWRWRLPQYEAVIQKMETGIIPVSTKPNMMMPPEVGISPVLAYRVFALKDTNGLLNVAFAYGGAFPLYHTAYLYCSSGVIERGSFFDNKFPYRRQISDRWFKVTD